MKYYLDGLGPSIAVKVPHEDFFNSAFRIWINRKYFSEEICRLISMHKVWRDLGLRQHIVEYIPTLQKEVSMRRERVVPTKNGFMALMIALKEAVNKGGGYTSAYAPGKKRYKKGEIKG